MKFQFCSLGKTHDSYVKEGIELFTKRVSSYYPVSWHIIPPAKNSSSLDETGLKIKEGNQIMAVLKDEEYLVLLDEKGKQLSSPGLATFLQQRGNQSEKTIVFLIGGAFGVSDSILNRADFTWSLSELVFPHQLARLILAEQVYRACTILRNEKYHHC